jgi:metal-sulfur cluster biosynthetic enzyme
MTEPTPETAGTGARTAVETMDGADTGSDTGTDVGTTGTGAPVGKPMRDVVDPELGVNVVDLGLLYDVHIADDASVTLDMTLTSAACPLTDVIEDQTNLALEGMVSDVRINWVWMPPWGPDKITDEGREQLRALGFNV